jgi:hypothetical protein
MKNTCFSRYTEFKEEKGWLGVRRAFGGEGVVGIWCVTGWVCVRVVGCDLEQVWLSCVRSGGSSFWVSLLPTTTILSTPSSRCVSTGCSSGALGPPIVSFVFSLEFHPPSARGVRWLARLPCSRAPAFLPWWGHSNQRLSLYCAALTLSSPTCAVIRSRYMHVSRAHDEVLFLVTRAPPHPCLL